MKTIYLWIGSCLISACAGGLIVRQYYIKPIPNPIPVKPNPVISPVIPMPIKPTFSALEEELKHYHYDMPTIDWKVLNQNRTKMNVEINGTLYQRHFSQSAEIPIVQTSSGNWKIKLGFAGGLVLAGGAMYGAHKLGWIKF